MGGKLIEAVRSRLPGLLLIAYLCATDHAFSFRAVPQVASAATACAGAEPQLRTAGKALDAGALVEAGQILTPLESLYPRCSEVVLGLARLHASQKDAVTAQELFSRSIDLAPQDPRPYYYLAQSYFSKGQYQQADHLSEQAVARDPAYPAALMLRGQILLIKAQPGAGSGIAGESLQA